MMMRRIRLPLLAGVACLLVGLSACRRTAFVTIETGSTTAQLVFLISRAADKAVALPAINGLSVLTDGCAESGVGPGKLVWRIWARDDHHPVLSRVVYGVPPVGFNTTTNPISLSAGCYAVEVASPGYDATLSFRVLSDGTVRVETPSR
jgi:hypothetical protein